MVSESSRVAALFGFLGLVAGALGGSYVDNYLQRDRDIERYLFQLRLEGIQSFLQGQAGIGGINPKDDTPITPLQRTNYGRYLIAVSGPPKWVNAVHNWMQEEQKHGKQFNRCNNVGIASFDFYYNLRQALFENSGRYWFGLVRQRDQIDRQTIGEVAVHCLSKRE